MCTLNFLKLTAGAPDAAWVSGDYATVENAFATWWTAMKVWYPATTTLVEYRWFKWGPDWDVEGTNPPNPATRSTAVSVAGTGSTASGVAPPQIAVSVTLQHAIRKRWGRVYLPAPVLVPAAGAIFDANGRLTSTLYAACRSNMVTALNSCRAANLIPVVWSKHRSEYTSAISGAHFDEHAATAYEITAVQVDNLADVVRRRRYDGPTVRSAANLT